MISIIIIIIIMVKMKKIIMKKELKGWSSPATAFLSNKENDRLLHKQFHSWYLMITGKHKIMSKLATQSFHILRLIARNPNFSRPKVPYFNVSRLSRQSRLHEVICIYVFRHTSLFMPLYRNIFLYMGIYICLIGIAYCLWILNKLACLKT